MRNYLCIDCGGTYTKYAVIREDHTLLKRGRVRTECDDYGLFMANIRGIYEENRDVCGIAMSLPGMLDVERGYAHTGGAIWCIYDKNIAAEISAACDGLPVTIENDAKAAGMAEVADGALKGCKNGVVIVVGTALGGTIVINGEVVRGRNLFAGEVSYLYYSNEFMAEKVPSGDAEERQLFYKRCTPSGMCRIYTQRTGIPLGSTDCPWLFSQYKKGDPDAEYAIRACCHDLAMLLFNIQCIMDPEVIAIGGGVSSEEAFIEMLREEVSLYAQHPLRGVPQPVIEACRHKNDANLLGAYYAHRRRMGEAAVCGL